MNKTYLSRSGQLALALFFAATAAAQSITPPSPLQTTIISNITATTVIDCPTYATCIDNRSQQYRRNNYHAFRVTGTGIWSVQMQYADGTPTSWTSFGASALVTNASPVSGVGYGLGYHDFISWVITGTATISNYSGSKNYWTAGVTNTFSFPITTPQGGAAGLADVVAGSPAAACTAVGSTGKMLLTATYTGLTSQTLACNISATAGGILKPASGQTITLTGSFDGDLTQHFDLSAGGTVNLASAKVTALYPQWWGAKCGGVDDTTAVQNTFNAVSQNQTIIFPCTSTVSSTVYVPNAAQGIILQGRSFPSGNTVGNDSLIANSSATGTVLKVYAPSTHLENFGVNCNGYASIGIEAVNTYGGYWDTVQTEGCHHTGANTGDGIQINSQGGTAVTITSNVSSGATTLPVSSVTLQGQAFGDESCGNIEIDYGTSVAEHVTSSAPSGLNLTIGALSHNHSSGAVVSCLGTNSELKMFNRHAFSNDEWGLNVVNDPANNENSMQDHSPWSLGNCAASLSAGTCGGSVWSGNINETDNGHYEGDKGYAIMLGDASAASSASNTGRQTVDFVAVNPFLDLEESSGTYDVLYGICSEDSNLIFKDIREFKNAVNPNGCAVYSGGPNLDVGYGNHITSSAEEWCAKNVNSMICMNPNAGGYIGTYANDFTTATGYIQLIPGGSGFWSTNTPGVSGADNIASSSGRTLGLCSYGNCGGNLTLQLGPNGGISLGADTDCGSTAAGHSAVCMPLHTPASSSETCVAGTFLFDTGYAYVCTSTNTWKRAALSGF